MISTLRNTRSLRIENKKFLINFSLFACFIEPYDSKESVHNFHNYLFHNLRNIYILWHENNKKIIHGNNTPLLRMNQLQNVVVGKVAGNPP